MRERDIKAVSIREVAARAGVSPGTVSHVLNNNAAARIAVSTQERVRSVATELGYRPNRYARSLGRRKTDTIGLLISGLRNPFFVELLENAENAAFSAGYSVLLGTAPSEHGTYKTHAPVTSAWPVDGALVWSWSVQKAEEFLGAQADTLPIVYLGGQREDNSDWISFDYEQGGRLAAEHLHQQGRRHVAYVSPYRSRTFSGDPNDPIEEARCVGCREVCAANGMTLSQIITSGEETRIAGLQAGMAIAAMPKSERPDALFCHNDVLAIGVFNGLMRAGVSVPDEIAIIGFDGIEDCRSQSRALTTVHTDTRRMTMIALELLTRRINGDYETAPMQLVMSPELIPGETT